MSQAVALQRPTTFPWRTYALAVLYFLVALAVLWFFGMHSSASDTTTLDINGQNATHRLPQIVVSTRLASYFLAAVCAFMGGLQLARIGRGAWLLSVVIFSAVAAFMIWAARDNTLDVINVMENSLLGAVPIAIGALSGVLCERAGVINIAIEGQMLTAAFMSVLITGATQHPWLGLIAGILSGGLLGWVLALLTLRYRVDQIIAGFVIDVFATGFTSYLFIEVLETNTSLNSAPVFPAVSVPGLSTLPVVGSIIFSNSIFVYLMVLLVVVTHVALYYTRWGLRVRSVGEHPVAAATVGIDPIRIRYINVILGGAMAGLAGCYFTLGAAGRFDQTMTSGQGFIALVAVILGGWNPIGACLAAILFGFAVSVQTVLGIFNVNIDPNILSTIPYIATILAVAGVVGRTRPPAADGQPYIKE